ncbi:MAG TPA: DUF5714 domain-containing protein [Terriglobales bacterium]|nr:DUF5714 domain-containing protein [Terriglobales bacterium]
MTGHHETGCLICGAPVVYTEPVRRRCAVCGKVFKADAVCERGHFVCDACHAAGLPDYIKKMAASAEGDPIRLLETVFRQDGVHMHGPEHHAILPCALLVAYKNCGGDIDLAKAIPAALERGGKVPGGTCGYWGVCGAAAGAGIYASIVTGATPLTDAVWTAPQKLAAECITAIARLGGVRCCKRTSFTAAIRAAEWTREVTGVELPVSRPVCSFYPKNRECLGAACPYFPIK